LNKYTWAVEDIYESDKKWQEDFDKVSTMLNFDEYKGKLKNPKVFLSCMKAQEKVCRIFDKLSVYAMMKHDENTKDAFYDGLVSKIMSYGNGIKVIEPKILKDKIINYLL
jgi:oligoendopeptidase F